MSRNMHGNRMHLSPVESHHSTSGASLRTLLGIGPKTAERLHENNIRNMRDLLSRIPKQYDDLRRLTPIKEVREGMTVVTKGTVGRFLMCWNNSSIPCLCR